MIIFVLYISQVRRCMEVVGRFHYHVIGGATGSGKGRLLDCLRDQGGQVPSVLACVAFPCTLLACCLVALPLVLFPLTTAYCAETALLLLTLVSSKFFVCITY